MEAPPGLRVPRHLSPWVPTQCQVEVAGRGPVHLLHGHCPRPCLVPCGSFGALCGCSQSQAQSLGAEPASCTGTVSRAQGRKGWGFGHCWGDECCGFCDGRRGRFLCMVLQAAQVGPLPSLPISADSELPGGGAGHWSTVSHAGASTYPPGGNRGCPRQQELPGQRL